MKNRTIKPEQWVMLPTENKSIAKHDSREYEDCMFTDDIPRGTKYVHPKGTLTKHNKTGKLAIARSSQTKFSQAQHLYLISYEDDIKDGDWFYDEDIKEIRNDDYIGGINIYKIIATTDRDLKSQTIVNKYGTHHLGYLLIPEEFIKYYVEKQGKIGDVEEIFHPMGDASHFEYKPIENKPKEVFTFGGKTLYTKEQVKQAILDWDSYITTRGKMLGKSLDKWIEDDL